MIAALAADLKPDIAAITTAAPRRAEEIVERAARWPEREGGAEVRPCPLLNISHLPAAARIDGSCLLPPP
ncbi:hypothetical protein, partial [Rathayibacter rathayi]|uniref:hypothetical protein n=2 Tax=Rathayibacter rathayi TaxID=33887 RepID=UPI001CA56DF9